jgi:epoxyqueuosine reductase
MDPAQLTSVLKAQAAKVGFDLVGACPAVEPQGLSNLARWIEAGYAGQMRYLESRLEAYRHPRYVLEGCRSLLMLGMNYRTAEPAAAAPGQGRVSRYAWNSDYHEVLRQRLARLIDVLQTHVPSARARGVVDTAPLMEREFAQLAGLGWVGKNTLLLNKHIGSWFFLAALLTDQELHYDAPHAADHCGTCRACLDACPTQAFVAPYVLDSRRCISYSTIEHRGDVPFAMRSGHGDWLFGCDICQEVCPWNSRAPRQRDPAFAPAEGMNPVDLAALFELDEEAFRLRFRQTPLWRAKRRGILRNAAIVLGNQRCEAARLALERGAIDADPIVREACSWALTELDQRNNQEKSCKMPLAAPR